jgi:perosamine synthetase
LIPTYSGYRVGSDEGGPQCEKLERELEQYYKVAHARVFNSATSALHAACVALGVGKGDKVIVPNYTMSASAAAVVHAGATPVLTDIADDYCLDWGAARRNLSGRVRAIMPVHLFGHHTAVPDWAREFDIIHDCSQSPSVLPDASLRSIWVHSLNQWKIITCGEGGYALTNSSALAARMHSVRNHGECFSEDIIGHNYRMTEMQAAIAREEFNILDKRLDERREWAAEFSSKHDLRDYNNRDWFLYPVRCEPAERDNTAGRIGGRVGYHRLISELPWFKAHGHADVQTPNAALIESELVVVNPLCA